MALADSDLISSPTSSSSRNFTANVWCIKQGSLFFSVLHCRNGSFPKIYDGELIEAEASDYVIAIASVLSF